MTPDAVRAHRHSIRHHDEVLASHLCGCFYCCETFPTADIVKWDGRIGRRRADGALPSLRDRFGDWVGVGYPVTREFLQQMHDRWFGTD